MLCIWLEAAAAAEIPTRLRIPTLLYFLLVLLNRLLLPLFVDACPEVLPCSSSAATHSDRITFV